MRELQVLAQGDAVPPVLDPLALDRRGQICCVCFPIFTTLVEAMILPTFVMHSLQPRPEEVDIKEAGVRQSSFIALQACDLMVVCIPSVLQNFRFAR